MVLYLFFVTFIDFFTLYCIVKQMNKLPVKLNICPIKEAVIEIRYTSELPSEAIFGITYSKINKFFDNMHKLPILQIPESVRNQDINLTYQPHYNFIKDKINCKIGPHIISFSNFDEYAGWHTFYPFVKKTLEEIKPLGVISNPERIGIRYTNLFNNTILDKINLNIKYKNKQFITENFNLRTESEEEKFTIILQISNNIPMKIANKELIGSLIDIDCIYNFTNKMNFFEIYETILNSGHELEKKKFFDLLKSEFLNSLQPEYGS